MLTVTEAVAGGGRVLLSTLTAGGEQAGQGDGDLAPALQQLHLQWITIKRQTSENFLRRGANRKLSEAQHRECLPVAVIRVLRQRDVRFLLVVGPPFAKGLK